MCQLGTGLGTCMAHELAQIGTAQLCVFAMPVIATNTQRALICYSLATTVGTVHANRSCSNECSLQLRALKV